MFKLNFTKTCREYWSVLYWAYISTGYSRLFLQHQSEIQTAILVQLSLIFYI